MELVAIRQVLLERCRLSVVQPVLVGVSGGPDSLCLLDLLFRLGYPVIAAHFDHQLRPESGCDEQFVSKLAASYQVPYISGSEDIRRLAQVNRQSIEEAARQARYRWLFARAEEAKAQAVAVAHHADDQVETILMHLLRGTGLSGLSGMEYFSHTHEWSSPIPLVRPLLSTWRSEIEEYCRLRRLKPLNDPTNQQTTYHRNRLRHELIPYLEQYNPRVKQVIWRMAETTSADHAVLRTVFEPVWDACLVRRGPHHLQFSLSQLRLQQVGMLRMVLRRAAAELLPGLRDFDFNTVECARKFIHFPTSTGQVDLAENLKLFVEGDSLFLSRWDQPVVDPEWPQAAIGRIQELPVPGRLDLEGGFSLTASLITGKKLPQVETINREEAFLDADLVELPLIVRTRRPGDRFLPVGMEGHSLKLSDFFINIHLPIRSRNGWPLVFSGAQIAWIAGIRPAHTFRVTQQTRVVLYLTLERNGSGNNVKSG